MNLHYRLVIVSWFTMMSSFAYCQQSHQMEIGLNVSYFKDWKSLKYGIFNPELSYSRILSDKYGLTYTLNAFYADNLSKEVKKEGGVIHRLIFSNDFTFDYFIKDFFVSAGPSIRYRNERRILYFYPQPNPFEMVTDLKKSHIDIGSAISSGYHLKTSGKSLITFKIAYRLYNKGVNPISLGASYGLSWN